MSGKIANQGQSRGYRPEIDGLRSIAVLLVILFHFNVSGFESGFVGVDIFYVISGYLISQIILTEVISGKFSFRAFYTRRARRIFPALFLVILVTLVLFAFVMFSWEYASLMESAAATVLFLANVHFWESQNYFSPSADIEPLLHMWSLSVEEQFYLIFPALLFLVYSKFNRLILFIIVAVLAVLSLGLAEWGWRNEPRVNFYFTPSRFWELGVGALAAMAPKLSNGRGAQWISNLSLVLLVASIALFNQDLPQPSIYLLPLILSTAAFLYSAGYGSIASQLFATKLPVLIGLLSYSAYLWHQPVVVFFRLSGLAVPAPVLPVLAIGITFFLAFLSKVLVEDPFRGRSTLYDPTTRAFWLGSLGIVSATVAFAMLDLSKPISKLRLGAQHFEVAERFANSRERMGVYSLGGCFLDAKQEIEALPTSCLPNGPKGILVAGDSHAAHLSVGVQENLPKGFAFAQINATGARPLLLPNSRPRDRRFVEFLHDLKAPEDSEWTIILSAGWNATFADVGAAAFEAALRTTVRKMQDNGFRVVLVLQSPSFEHSGWLRDVLRNTVLAANQSSVAQDHRPVNALLERVAADMKLGWFDPTKLLCQAKELLCQTVENGSFLYLDSGHFTVYGSRKLGAEMMSAAGFSSR